MYSLPSACHRGCNCVGLGAGRPGTVLGFGAELAVLGLGTGTTLLGFGGRTTLELAVLGFGAGSTLLGGFGGTVLLGGAGTVIVVVVVWGVQEMIGGRLRCRGSTCRAAAAPESSTTARNALSLMIRI